MTWEGQMWVSQDEILEQIQHDEREFRTYSVELQEALRAQVRVLRRSYRVDRPLTVEAQLRA